MSAGRSRVWHGAANMGEIGKMGMMGENAHYL